ncbi:MAG: hypothetical protein ACTSUP_09740 [Candidatus Heimdallarchaeaceae archaeon]
MPIIISHYTKNTPYEKEVKRLRASLEKFDLDHEIEGINSLGSWRANSNYCAWQIQKMLKKYYPRPVLRVDADAVFQQYPSLLEKKNFNPDVAAVIWYQYRTGGELLGGTLYFANNERTTRVVDNWVNLCKSLPHKRNPDLLQAIIWQEIPSFQMKKIWPEEKKSFSEGITFEKLPLEYCKIFDTMRKQVPNPVIEHFQASRRFRRGIDGTRGGRRTRIRRKPVEKIKIRNKSKGKK